MTKKVIGILGTLALVALSSAFAASVAFAQQGTPPAQTPPAAQGQSGNAPAAPRLDFGFFGGGSTAVFDAEAKALNLTPTQLFEQLHSGKTLSEIAQSQGVDLAKVQDAAKAARDQAAKDNINQAVKDGTMTQAQADWLLEGLDKGYWGGGPGFGPFGDHGMMRGGRGPALGGNGAPPAPTTSTQN